MNANFSWKEICPSFSQNQKKFFFFLTLLVGLAFLIPQLDYQDFIATGDHGRELYGFKKTMEGFVPYRDFSWVLGPLMPYYYALLFKILGATIQTAVLGKTLLFFLTGLAVYSIAASFLTPGFSFLCAVSCWALREKGFFYTYIHDGGILFLMLTLLTLFKYIDRPQVRYVFFGFLSALGLILIRPNIGLIATFIFFLFLILSDQSRKDPLRKIKFTVYLLCALLLAVSALFIYWSCVKDLPSYTLQQNFPFLSSSRADASSDPIQNLKSLFPGLFYQFWSTLSRKIFTLLLILSLISTFRFVRKNSPVTPDQKITLKLWALALVILLNAHEFILSGVFYRWYWFHDVLLILGISFLDLGTRSLPWPALRGILLASLLFPTFGMMSDRNSFIDLFKKPQHLLQTNGNRIFSLQSPQWLATVEATVNFINTAIPKDENIFVLPYDALYYFLTGRSSPVRQIMLFQHLNITPQEERDLIQSLETKKVNYLLISNRAFYPTEPGMGVFGKDYCPQLKQYIDKNFTVIAVMGYFDQPAGWNDGHAVKILKRIS